MIYVCAIKCILDTSTTLIFYGLRSGPLATLGVLAYLGVENTQQSDTPKHMRTVCIRMFTYIHSQLDLVIVEVITLALPTLLAIGMLVQTDIRTANFKHYYIATNI